MPGLLGGRNMQNHPFPKRWSLLEVKPYSKIKGSAGSLKIIISLYSSAWHSEKLSLGVEYRT